MHHVLWTGGWDSTFRVLELVLVLKEPVQTHYILDPNRKSAEMELAAMQRIRETVLSRYPEAALRFPPLVVFPLDAIAPNEEITRNYRIISKRSLAGSQYDWLCRYARQQGLPNLEMGIERTIKPHSSHIYMTLRFGGDFVPVSSGSDFYYTLMENPPHPEMENFRGFRFPLLDKTKLDLAREASEYGFSDLMEMTWFCHSPDKDGKPCGVCHPCQQARIEGMGRRVPPLTFKKRLILLKSNLGELFKRKRRS